jgi:hypothetical protein
MMNRGVMERQMFARGGAVQRFQAGGPAMPMQGDPMGRADGRRADARDTSAGRPKPSAA